MNKVFKSRITLIGLILIFFLPILLSWYLVFISDYKNKIGSVENGDLINPVVKIGEINVVNIKNRQISYISNRWTLVFFVDKECNDDCQKKLYQARQIRLALGKNIDKVDRLLISKKSIDWTNMAENYSGQKILEIGMKDYERVQNSFNLISDFSFNSFYLIDPYGFLMMSYPENSEPKGIIKDIERLIRNAG